MPTLTIRNLPDTLFIAAAELRGTRVVTFDRRLLGLFPGLASMPSAFLGH
ncbi:hypothetical protein [Endothiovibrio diazotrophicus]